MAASRDLLNGFAQLLAAAGIGLTWNSAGVYTAGQTGIFMMFVPTTPDRCVVLNLVNTSDDPSMPLGSAMLQVRGRGARNNPLDVADLLDPIFDTLHGITNLVIGGQTVIQCRRQVSAPMGIDGNVRAERADQYYLDVDAVATALRPDGGSW